jgi:hypothetical protein
MMPPEDDGRGGQGPRLLREVIEETTVGGYGDCSVGVSNIWERDYKGVDGQPGHGISASVSLWGGNLPERHEIVGPGSELDLGPDGKWRVTDVRRGKGSEPGSITIERLDDQ